VYFSPSCTLDLFVENLGRANFGTPHVFPAQKKGRRGKSFPEIVSKLGSSLKGPSCQITILETVDGGWEKISGNSFGVGLL
jgi:hypothetical protein